MASKPSVKFHASNQKSVPGWNRLDLILLSVNILYSLCYREKLQAFIWDSSRLEYEDANDCDLVTAGELFGRSGLGVGLKKGSPWTHQISLAILELHEGGQMEKLDNKWILVESSDCPQRDHTPATLGLTNMAGKLFCLNITSFLCTKTYVETVTGSKDQDVIITKSLYTSNI